MRTKLLKRVTRVSVSSAVMALVGISASAQSPTHTTGIARAPQAVIDQHIDRRWFQANMLELLEHWRTASVMPNGFIQENLDRQWKPWGAQEATLNGQSRQLYTMVEGYEYTHDKRYLDAVNKAFDFLMKMHDDQYGGFFNRTTSDAKVLDDTKTSAMSFTIFALANAYRVTKDAKYEKVAMDTFRILTGKMRDGESFKGTMSRDFSGSAVSPYAATAHHTDIPDYGPAATVAPAAATAGPAEPAPPRRPAPVRHNMNARVVEAFLQLYEATHSKEVWEEITAQMAVMTKMYDYEQGYMPSSVDENWKPVPGGEPSRPFEWASTFSKLVELGGDPKFIEMGSRSINYGLKVDYNNAVGGSGGIDAQGRPTIMFWWSQCELLKTLGRYAALHGRSDLWPYFDRTLALVKNSFLDAQYGGWFESLVPGWSREELSKKTERAYIKGAAEGAEFAAYHQTFMFTDLLAATKPH